MIEFTSMYNCEFCSGHSNKSQVVNYRLLAIFTFTPCQRAVNRPRRNPSFQSKWMLLTQPEQTEFEFFNFN